MTELLVQYGEVIGYVLTGLIAFIGLGFVQLIRRRRDVKSARLAVRLASHSINEPRLGAIAVKGTYRVSQVERWMECNGGHVALDGELTVVRGTSARWQQGARTYAVNNGDVVIAIGVMSKRDLGWRLVASPGEDGIQILAVEPRPAPPPLWPWRAPLVLALCGALAYVGLYGVGTVLIDVPATDDEAHCGERLMRFGIATALPLVRDDAVTRYEAAKRRCETPP